MSLAGCRNNRSDARPSIPAAASPQNQAQEWFTDRAAEAGLNYVHVNGMSGELYYSEIMAPGVGLLDYDNDGDLDVFLVQGQMLGPGKTPGQALFPPRGPLPIEGRLYCNDLEGHADGTRTLRFADVTEASGIKARGYGMGVTAGDFNNDGCVDLYLTNFGPDQLLRNNCNGTFTDVSAVLGTTQTAPSRSVSASFLTSIATEAGGYDEAVMWQQQAMAIAERARRADISAHLAQNLRLFERHQPCRRPWRDDDPVGGFEP